MNIVQRRSRGSRPWLAIGSALVCGAVLLVRHRTLNISVDEAYALDTSSGSLARTVRRALRFEVQPAGYFVTLSLWRRIDRSLAFARDLSALAVLAALWPLDRRLATASPRARSYAAALYLFHPATTFYGSEAKAYALTVALSATLFDLGATPTAPGRLIAFAVVAAIAINVQYYTAFGVAALVVRALLEGRRRDAVSLAVAALPAILAIVPTLRALPAQLATTEMERTPPGTALRTALAHTLSFIVPIRSPRKRMRSLIDLGAVMLVAFTVVRTPARRNALRKTRTPSLLAIVAAFHALGSSVLGAPMNFPNQLTVLYAAFIAAAGELAALVERDATPLERAIAQLLIAGLAARTLLASVYPGARRGDWKRVAASLHAAESAGEPIFVFNAEDTIALAYHYGGRNALVPIPRPMPRDVWDQTARVVRSTAEVAAAMQGPEPFETCWLATTPGVDIRGMNMRADLVEAYVADRFDVLDTKTFYYATLRRLRRR